MPRKVMDRFESMNGPVREIDPRTGMEKELATSLPQRVVVRHFLLNTPRPGDIQLKRYGFLVRAGGISMLTDTQINDAYKRIKKRWRMEV